MEIWQHVSIAWILHSTVTTDRNPVYVKYGVYEMARPLPSVMYVMFSDVSRSKKTHITLCNMKFANYQHVTNI